MKAVAAFAALLLAGAAHGAPRIVSCRIVSQGEAPYLGRCTFLPEGGGSFTIQPVGKRFFYPRISSITVSITAPGIAQISGLTAAGIDSRWGEARRENGAPACWLGGDFRICVY